MAVLPRANLFLRKNMFSLQFRVFSFIHHNPIYVISSQVSPQQALRHSLACLTQGDTIEIICNSVVFGFLIMKTNPGGEGIDVLDTDVEVDFAVPKGYVEPERLSSHSHSGLESRVTTQVLNCISM